MRSRFVAAEAENGSLKHAVWVPHDLPVAPSNTILRPGRAPLVLSSRWSAEAECGQLVVRIIAGPNGGNDWDRASRPKCFRCVKLVSS